RSLTRPRLDFVSSYQVNAFGDRLFGQSDDDDAGAPQGLASAYETLTQGDQTGWTLGLEFSMPIGFRSAQAQVRNYELRIAKARDVLAAQELEISHELATVFQNLAANHATASTNFQRWRAAQQFVEIFEQRRRAEAPVDADLFLRALQTLAEAERAYYESLVRYNQAIAEYYYRKGMLLERNNVYLAEGAWTPEAYDDALRRAWARSHAIEVEHMESEPPPFAFPVDQGHIIMPGVPLEPLAPPAEFDRLPLPDPVPPPPAPAAEAEVSLFERETEPGNESEASPFRLTGFDDQ
ncbi:MAG: TolC family protein, partial [Nitriliruptorales bacterium]